mgnify:CR=1 FL=1
MLRNLFLTLCSIILFAAGMFAYGTLLLASKKTIYEEMQAKGIKEIKTPHILVERSKNQLHFFEDSVKIKTYVCFFGTNPSREKNSYNDNATPLGEYKIIRISQDSNLYKFFLLNYPTKEQAKSAFLKKIIDYNDYLSIVNSPDTAKYPELYSLKFKFGIHGCGRFNSFIKYLPFPFNWTNGSIAITNEDIDEISNFIKIGSPVKIVF